MIAETNKFENKNNKFNKPLKRMTKRITSGDANYHSQE